MAFKIERNDITKVHTEAIVNTANPLPCVGTGTDSAVYKAAGWDELLNARKKIGIIKFGTSVVTKSYGLSKNGIKYIIHTVGCHYDPKDEESIQILRSCYSSSLKIAKDLSCKSVALPLLASGNYGFPKDLALKIAVEEISAFLLQNEIDVTLIVYDINSYMISEKLFADIQDFLNENLEDDVDSFIKQSGEVLNFQNTLQYRIAQSHLENATVYKKACIDKKFFSKIISNKDYVPKKQVVMALGLALELPYKEFEQFLASAGYAFMPSSKFDLIVKYCVMNKIYNLLEVDIILDSHGLNCFAAS